VDWAETVFWVPSFVESFFVLGFDFPDAFFVEREGAPAVAYGRKMLVISEGGICLRTDYFG